MRRRSAFISVTRISKISLTFSLKAFLRFRLGRLAVFFDSRAIDLPWVYTLGLMILKCQWEPHVALPGTEAMVRA